MNSCLKKKDPFPLFTNLCENGELDEAFHGLKCIHSRGVQIPIRSLFCLIRSCISTKDSSIGQKVQILIHESGFGSNAFLSSHLVHMFSAFGTLSDTKHVFSRLFRDEQTVFTWNAIISAHVKLGKHKDAIDLYGQLLTSFVLPDRHVFMSVLKACTCRDALHYGRKIHSHITEFGFDTNRIVGNTLVAMYIKNECIDDSHVVFTSLLEKDVVSWNALISGYCHNNLLDSALRSFVEMYSNNLNPTTITFACVLKACANGCVLHEGTHIHNIIVKSCLEQDPFVGNSLIDLYAKCGSLEDAQNMFEKLIQRDVATWNAMIGAYAQNGLGKLSIELFQEMQRMSIEPDNITFLNILKACSSITDLELGKSIDTLISSSGFGSDARVASTLIDMYLKCGSLDHANNIFLNLKVRDCVMWNTMIRGYEEHGKNQETLQLMQRMHEEGIEPDEVTFVSLLRVISTKGSVQLGKVLHTWIVEMSLENEPFVENSIIDMYTKTGSMSNACILFDRLSKIDIIPWNVMISGYVQHHQDQEAITLFCGVINEGVKPDKLTFVSVLRACCATLTLGLGNLIHSYIIESEYESDLTIRATLIEMYADFGRMDNSITVFNKTSVHDVLAWNSLISGYVHCEQPHKALEAFEEMQKNAIQPNQLTIISILQACSRLATLEPNKLANDFITKSGFDSDVYVMSTLLDAYAKCGKMDEALHTFSSLQSRSVVAWTGMISGYVENQDGEAALTFFYRMQREGVEPNQATFICAVKACIILPDLDQGKLVHSCIIRKGFGSDEVIGSVLIDMYATCGNINDACKVFFGLPKRDVVTWNALMTGFTLCNDHGMALHQFQEMQHEGLHPDVVTLTSVLSACSHKGLLDEGCNIFELIQENHDISLTVDHLNCLADVLGRGGLLCKAEDLLQAFPSLQNSIGWRSLLGHCETHGNRELGRRCFNQLIRLGNVNAGVYRIMSNIYSQAGMWEEANALEELRARVPKKLMEGFD